MFRFQNLGQKRIKQVPRLKDKAEDLLQIRDGLAGQRQRSKKTLKFKQSSRNKSPSHITWSSWRSNNSAKVQQRRGRTHVTTPSPIFIKKIAERNNSCLWDTVRGRCQAANSSSFPLVRLPVPTQRLRLLEKDDHTQATTTSSSVFTSGTTKSNPFPSFSSFSHRNQIVSQVFMSKDQEPNNLPVDTKTENVRTNENFKLSLVTTRQPQFKIKGKTVERSRKPAKEKDIITSTKRGHRRKRPRCNRASPGACRRKFGGRQPKVIKATSNSNSPSAGTSSSLTSQNKKVSEKTKFSQLLPKRDKITKIEVERKKAELEEARKKKRAEVLEALRKRKEAENLEAKKIRETIQQNLEEREERRRKELSLKKKNARKSREKKLTNKPRQGKALKEKHTRIGKALWTVEEWLRRGWNQKLFICSASMLCDV